MTKRTLLSEGEELCGSEMALLLGILKGCKYIGDDTYLYDARKSELSIRDIRSRIDSLSYHIEEDDGDFMTTRLSIASTVDGKFITFTEGKYFKVVDAIEILMKKLGYEVQEV